MPLKPGVHELDEAAYHADPCPEPSLSSGIAHRLITQSPAHAWHAHPRLNPNYKPEDSDTFDLGACAHAMLFRVGAPIVAIDPNDYPGKRGGIPVGWTNDAIREARDSARAAGKIPVFKHQALECSAMTKAAEQFLARLEEPKINLADGKAEQTLIWREGEVWCRARPDWRRNDLAVMVDYKSTAGSANPAVWIRNQLFSLGYDLQAAHYLRGNLCTGGRGRSKAKWFWLVQENYPPFACSLIEATPPLLELAESKRECAVGLWQSCMKLNKWPAYEPRAVSAEPPPWELDRWAGNALSRGDEKTLDRMIELASQA